MNEFLKFLNFIFPKSQSKMLLKDILPELLIDLYYPSESDEPIELFSIAETPAVPIEEATFRELLKIDEETLLEPLNVGQFWNNVTTIKEWYDEEQAAKTKQFEQLRTTLFEHLDFVQGFRVGEVEVDVYLFGKNEAGEIEGIKTMLVET